MYTLLLPPSAQDDRGFSGETQNGSLCRTIVSATTRKDDHGRIVGSLAMLTDITARKRAEEALQQSERKTKEASGKLSHFWMGTKESFHQEFTKE